MNWGYWGNIGIVASAEYRARMAQAGLGSIEAGEGMVALEVLLGGPQNQLALVKTTRPLKTLDVLPEQLRIYPSEVSSAAARLQADQKRPGQGGPPEGRAVWQEIDELAGKLLWTQLVAAGFPASGKVTAIKAALGLHGSYDRWLDESLTVLITRGYLKQDGETVFGGRGDRAGG